MSIIKKKSGLLMYQKKSAEYMEKIKTTPYPDWKSLHQDLYGFILSKYIPVSYTHLTLPTKA